jgi:hypothetical protein
LATRTASEAESLVSGQLKGLRDFLVDSPVPGAARGDLALGFRHFLEQDLVASHDGDVLGRQLSQEFASSLWRALLREMAMKSSDGKAVARGDLLPLTDDDSNTRWQEVFQSVAQYSIEPGEISGILKAVFEELVKTSPSDDRIQFPRGMFIEKSMLARVVNDEPEPTEANPVIEFLRSFFRRVTGWA